MYDGYVFLCNNATLQQCLSEKKYACASGQPKPDSPVKEGSVIFLYNREEETLLGPFTALTEGGSELDSGAWSMSVTEKIPSEDLQVTWETLHLIRDAKSKLPLLKEMKTCRLTSLETQNVLDVLRQGELFMEAGQETD
jgi:hypothetical protein